MSDTPDEPPSLQRLDPDRAAGERAERAAGSGADAAAGQPAPPPDGPPDGPPTGSRARVRTAPTVVDPRRYRWMVGIIGLVVVIVFSVHQFLTHGFDSSTGVAPGHRLHEFAAPLADTNLNGDANPHPICTPAGHDPRALNVCLLAGRGPLVLSFFVTGAPQCERQVDALQTLSRRFPQVQFAAVAISASHATTARAVRAHGWTIPVAYDADGTVQQLYGVVACPMAELAARGGIVRDRLIGNRWQTVASLTPYVRALANGAS